MNTSNILLWLFTAICAGGAAYLGAYLKAKGENLATHEDIQKLVSEVEATTAATKAIEGRIGDEFWNKQRVWEMKRDALLAYLGALGELGEAALDIGTAFESTRDPQVASFIPQLRTEASKKFTAAMMAVASRNLAVNVLCGERMKKAMLKTQGEAMEIRLAAENDIRSVLVALHKFSKERDALLEAIRDELGVCHSSSSTTTPPPPMPAH